MSFQAYLQQQHHDDLCWILSEIERNNIMSFSQILQQISQGFGLIIVEETGFALERDYDNPEEFQDIIFFVSGHESSKISKSQFCERLQYLSTIYLIDYPEKTAPVQQYMQAIIQRYNPPQ